MTVNDKPVRIIEVIVTNPPDKAKAGKAGAASASGSVDVVQVRVKTTRGPAQALLGADEAFVLATGDSNEQIPTLGTAQHLVEAECPQESKHYDTGNDAMCKPC